MVNRKEKDITNFIVEINKVWQLNLNEESFLKEILGLILKPNKTFNLVESALDKDYSILLQYIPNHYIEDYAKDYLDLVDENDCETSDINDFDDNELLEECEERGLTIGYETSDIVTDSQVFEMMDLFLSFPSQKREDLINDLKRW